MRNILLALFILSLSLIASISVTQVHAQNLFPKLVGVYQGAPGFINNRFFGGCGIKGCTWPDSLPPHPTLGKYDSGSGEYINWSLDRMAQIGIDFVILDESNGIHLQIPPLEADLLNYMDIVDSRIARGVPTPKVTIMSPLSDVNKDSDWVWNNLVNKNGNPRTGWLWFQGKPLWGIYSLRPFVTTFIDNRFTIRYIANSQGDDCHQPQKDLGTVWCWGTRFENGPIYSPRSEQVTIQNGFDDSVACLDYWGRENDPSCFIHDGFTPQYYSDQWDRAINYNPQIIVTTSYGGGAQVEGGQIEQRVDFSPPTVYEEITKNKVSLWKGTTPTPIPPRPNLCGSSSISSSIISSSNPLTVTMTANKPVKNFSLAFYNPDNLYGPGNPKPLYFEAGKQFSISKEATSLTQTISFIINYADIDKPDLNNNGQKPTNIQVNGYFLDPATGQTSLPDARCVVQFNIERPGDLDGDGDVDSSDFNKMVADFGHPYTIFDYNVLIGNFGK